MLTPVTLVGKKENESHRANGFQFTKPIYRGEEGLAADILVESLKGFMGLSDPGSGAIPVRGRPERKGLALAARGFASALRSRGERPCRRPRPPSSPNVWTADRHEKVRQLVIVSNVFEHPPADGKVRYEVTWYR